MTDEAMSPLRRRMIEDMTIRKFAPKTQQSYIGTVKDSNDETRAIGDAVINLTNGLEAVSVGQSRGLLKSSKIGSSYDAPRRSRGSSRGGCRTCSFCHAQLFEITQGAKVQIPNWQYSCRHVEVVPAFEADSR